jgi:hypothetical protein
MKSDLSKVKVGDKIWSFTNVYEVVTEIRKNNLYPIVTNKSSYTFDGKRWDGDYYPSAFLSNPFKVKKYMVGLEKQNFISTKNGIVIDDIFYVEIGCNQFEEIKEITLTKAEIASKFGIEVEQLKIID